MTTSKHGPLTQRQLMILENIIDGARHKDVAQKTGFPLSTIKHEMAVIVPKLGADTSAQACATYATATAYRNAANLIENDTHVPGGDALATEVLVGIVKILRERADALLPQ